MIFKDRSDAGRILAQKLSKDVSIPRSHDLAVVLGIPRGGLVTAKEVAALLNLPLDVVVVRKLGVPGDEELAFGAVDLDGNVVFNESALESLSLRSDEINKIKFKELNEAKRRQELFRKGKGDLNIAGRTVIVVDDGIATGETVEAAINYVKSRSPSRIILAAPVCAPETVERLKPLVDGLFILKSPAYFMAVGQFYENFPQVLDNQVISLLE